ncbi:MAG: prepilin peptidase [Desulfuromonas sp.]|nr:MAG: prepilin peptidase [Desulfuromonas sp.]
MKTLSWPHIAPIDHLCRPERDESGELEGVDHLWHQLHGRFLRHPARQLRWCRRQIAAIRAHETELKGLDEPDLQQRIRQLRIDLMRSGFRDDLVALSFALVCEVADRTLGMRHFDSQLIGGLVMICGMVAEMQTGEGKTLTATLPAATAALAGWPVHVISVNDYLTERDAEEMGPVYRALGLSVGCVVHGQQPPERQQAYRANVIYCTNKEVAFDYLRDKLVLQERQTPLRLMAEDLFKRNHRRQRLILPGLHFAIVDEADSILIDEARTPLIISGSDGNDQEQNFFEQALNLARSLARGEHFTLREETNEVRLTDSGKSLLEMRSETLDPVWRGTIRRESTVVQALVALNCFHRDEHYVVVEDKVQIVDEFTGRIMADRSWEKGLHQLIEVKEGCEITGQRESLARISYQKFFRRYLKLSGMTGTAHEIRHELWDVYNLSVVKIPTNKPVQRNILPDTIRSDIASKWEQVVSRTEEVRAEGRSVLIGTRSVASSEQLSDQLSERGIDHVVLNAKNDHEEAEIVSRAGEPHRVTIATNMAGRGTDIKLHPNVRKQGGLHVILTERHEAGRIDRQLFGRCGRQGDPGSCEAIVSIDDAMLTTRHASLPLSLLRRFPDTKGRWWQKIAFWGILRTQKRVEKYYAKVRRRLLKQDRQRTSLLSFSGRPD